ncbi:MAG: hypothetical protein ACR2MQ_13680 [Gemmatimonadaceae bacterium]
MKEIVLQNFFEGHAAVEELVADVVRAFDRHVNSSGTVFSRLNSVPMNHEFAVASTDIMKLIDAVQTEKLTLEALDAICFCLEASDHFHWDTDTVDGERVANSLFWLGTPEVNYPLTASALGKVRRYLQTGEETFTDVDLRAPGDRPYLVGGNEMHRDPGV